MARGPRPSVVKWRIYYDGGDTYSNLDGPVSEAPGYGVIVIAYADRATGRGLMRGFDFYVYDGEEWYGHDLWGLMERLFSRHKVESCFAGRSVSEVDFQLAWQKAKADPDLPKKTAKNRYKESPRVREMNT